MSIERKVQIWDLPTRIFHWALLALVLVAWFTGEEESTALLHRIAGESIAGLLVFRLVWGFVGGQHARFAAFAAGPKAIIAHVRDLFSRQPKRHLGHNPLGGVAVFLLLITVAGIVMTGLFSSGHDNAGPFAGMWGLEFGEIHEALFRVLQALVVVHVLGVIVETAKSKDALVPAMITGVKRRRADEDGQDARRAGAASFLAASLLALLVAGALMAQPPSSLATTGQHERGGQEQDD
jgi:cytochrome b